jgi:hypothetical protein
MTSQHRAGDPFGSRIIEATGCDPFWKGHHLGPVAQAWNRRDQIEGLTVRDREARLGKRAA